MQFRGRASFLSNFWPVMVKMDGVLYPSVEHAYQAAKTLDQTERDRIRCAMGAAQAKKIGKSVTMRPDWVSKRIPIMADLLKQKFQDPDLRRRLLDVGENPIVEQNTWHDNFWGRCICIECSESVVHQNMLGFLLTEIRKSIEEGKL